MTESALSAEIRLAVGRLRHVRLWRNNRGVFWAGKPVNRTESSVTLVHPRQVECGLANGAADLIGITQVTIGPEHIGQTLAVFTSAEVKRPGVTVPEHQEKWRAFVSDWGGRAAVVRSAEDALMLVKQ